MRPHPPSFKTPIAWLRFAHARLWEWIPSQSSVRSRAMLHRCRIDPCAGQFVFPVLDLVAVRFPRNCRKRSLAKLPFPPRPKIRCFRFCHPDSFPCLHSSPLDTILVSLPANENSTVSTSHPSFHRPQRIRSRSLTIPLRSAVASWTRRSGSSIQGGGRLSHCLGSNRTCEVDRIACCARGTLPCVPRGGAWMPNGCTEASQKRGKGSTGGIGNTC